MKMRKEGKILLVCLFLIIVPLVYSDSCWCGTYGGPVGGDCADDPAWCDGGECCEDCPSGEDPIDCNCNCAPESGNGGCSDACSSGEVRCQDSTRQECGECDNDDCLDWCNDECENDYSNSHCSDSTCVCDSGWADCDGDLSCECDLNDNECKNNECVPSAPDSVGLKCWIRDPVTNEDVTSGDVVIPGEYEYIPFFCNVSSSGGSLENAVLGFESYVVEDKANPAKRDGNTRRDYFVSANHVGGIYRDLTKTDPVYPVEPPLLNPSFNKGNVGWAFDDNGCGNIEIINSETTSYSPNSWRNPHHVHFSKTCTSTGMRAVQWVPVKPDTEYELTVAFRVNGDANDNIFLYLGAHEYLFSDDGSLAGTGSPINHPDTHVNDDFSVGSGWEIEDSYNDYHVVHGKFTTNAYPGDNLHQKLAVFVDPHRTFRGDIYIDEIQLHPVDSGYKVEVDEIQLERNNGVNRTLEDFDSWDDFENSGLALDFAYMSHIGYIDEGKLVVYGTPYEVVGYHRNPPLDFNVILPSEEDWSQYSKLRIKFGLSQRTHLSDLAVKAGYTVGGGNPLTGQWHYLLENGLLPGGEFEWEIDLDNPNYVFENSWQDTGDIDDWNTDIRTRVREIRITFSQFCQRWGFDGDTDSPEVSDGETDTYRCLLSTRDYPYTEGDQRIMFWTHVRDYEFDGNGNKENWWFGLQSCDSKGYDGGHTSFPSCWGGSWWGDGLARQEGNIKVIFEKPKIPKFTWDGSLIDVCEEDSQCLVDPEGSISLDNQPELYYDDPESPDQDIPKCIEDGQYIMDHLCDNGNWTSRTRKVAMQLFDKAVEDYEVDYTIFCDTYEKVLNYYDYPLESGKNTKMDFFDGNSCAGTGCLNNFCVLTDQDGNVRAMGSSLNTQTTDPMDETRLLELVEVSGGCGQDEDRQLHQCDPENLWYDTDVDVFVYGVEQENPVTLSTVNWESRYSNMRSLFREIFDTVSGSEEFLRRAHRFDRIYMSHKKGREINVRQESTEVDSENLQMIYGRYSGFDADLCSVFKEIESYSCMEQNGDYFIQSNSDDWVNLTSKLRVMLEVAVCGDGDLQFGEACDDGNTNACDGCAQDCSRNDNVCGDGVRECGEECDDGNLISGDGCSNQCVIAEVCDNSQDNDGDGLIGCRDPDCDGVLGPCGQICCGNICCSAPDRCEELSCEQGNCAYTLIDDCNYDCYFIKNVCPGESFVVGQGSGWMPYDDGQGRIKLYYRTLGGPVKVRRKFICTTETPITIPEAVTDYLVTESNYYTTATFGDAAFAWVDCSYNVTFENIDPSNIIIVSGMEIERVWDYESHLSVEWGLSVP